MIASLISFGIANLLVSMLGTWIVRSKYPKSNKYLIFSIFFIGYIILFLVSFLSK
jgi:hypothetical protein